MCICQCVKSEIYLTALTVLEVKSMHMSAAPSCPVISDWYIFLFLMLPTQHTKLVSFTYAQSSVHLFPFSLLLVPFTLNAQLVTAWYSTYLESGKPLKNIRPFRTAPQGGYKLKSQIQPSFLLDNSKIIPGVFQILPAMCEPVSFVSSQNPYLAAQHVFLQMSDHF